MKYNYFSAAIIVLCIFISYLNIQKFNAGLAESEFATVINEYLSQTQNIRAGNQTPASDGNGTNSTISGKEFKEETKILDDNSTLDTTHDGFGNKTEARCFNNHPRLTCIVISTAANGRRQGTVYGQNGSIQNLPDNLLDKALIANGDEIANSSGIYAARQPTQIRNAQSLPVQQSNQIQTPVNDNRIPKPNSSGEINNGVNTGNSEPATGNPKAKSTPSTANPQSNENEKLPISNLSPE